jgi:very-short-patch-repair endonuclease
VVEGNDLRRAAFEVEPRRQGPSPRVAKRNGERYGEGPVARALPFGEIRMRGIRIPETKRARALRREATGAERKLWLTLRGRLLGDHKFVRQERIGPYYADFACREAKLVVEIDGATHSTPEEVAKDQGRTAFMERQGYRVIRFTNDEVYKQIDRVCDAILAALAER